MHDLSRIYPVWFCDIWGVLHNGHEPYPATVDTLIRHRKANGTVVLVSNSPRSTKGVSLQLDQIGVPRGCYDTAVTSGDVTRDLIIHQKDGRLFHLGPERDLSVFTGLAVTRVPLDEASAVICTGLFHDDRETPADYAVLLRDIKNRDLTMICANPDKVVRHRQRLLYCAGALAEAYAAIGGKVLMAGKPYAPIYDLALRKAGEIRGELVTTSQVLAIGDGPGTDIQGAANQGMACVFVTGLEGETSDLASAHLAIRQAVPNANILRTVGSLNWS